MIAIKETTTRAASGEKPQGSRTSNAASGAKIDATANEFESEFVAQMLANMFATVDVQEAPGGSDAEEVYRSMIINEYGKIIARTGGVGVADQVKQIMIKQQEVN